MPKISVIIPVYNAEKYLAKSIESVLNQSLKDIEVICIDDGSTDKSLEILENYADKDKRIKIFRQKQSGPANVRNLGIDNSSSDIITFLDADDWVYSENSYEKIYNEMKADNLDLLAYNHYEYNNELAALLPDALRKYIFEYDDEDYNKVLLKDDFSKYVFKFSPFPWDKFYKKNLLIDNNIKFPLNLPAGEDSAFALYVMLYAEKIKFSKVKHIVYRTDLNTSLTNAKIHECLDYPVNVAKSIYNFLNERNLYNTYRIEFLTSNIHRVLGHYLSQTECGHERGIYLNIAGDFFKSLKINNKTLKQIAKLDMAALELLHNKLNYPIFIVFKLFNIIPIFQIKKRWHLKKYYILGVPVLEIVYKNMYSKNVYLFGRFFNIFSSQNY